MQPGVLLYCISVMQVCSEQRQKRTLFFPIFHLCVILTVSCLALLSTAISLYHSNFIQSQPNFSIPIAKTQYNSVFSYYMQYECLWTYIFTLLFAWFGCSYDSQHSAHTGFLHTLHPFVLDFANIRRSAQDLSCG